MEPRGLPIGWDWRPPAPSRPLPPPSAPFPHRLGAAGPGGPPAHLGGPRGCRAGGGAQGAGGGRWAGRVCRHGSAPPPASAAPSSPPRPPARSVLAPRSTPRPRAPQEAEPGPPRTRPSRAHGSPHARALRTDARSFPLARLALGGGRERIVRGTAERLRRAGGPTMEADGAGEQMRPLLTRVTSWARTQRATGSSAGARGAADKGGDAVSRPLVPARPPSRRRPARQAAPLCVAVRDEGRRRRGGPRVAAVRPGLSASGEPGGPPLNSPPAPVSVWPTAPGSPLRWPWRWS